MKTLLIYPILTLILLIGYNTNFSGFVDVAIILAWCLTIMCSIGCLFWLSDEFRAKQVIPEPSFVYMAVGRTAFAIFIASLSYYQHGMLAGLMILNFIVFYVLLREERERRAKG